MDSLVCYGSAIYFDSSGIECISKEIEKFIGKKKITIFIDYHKYLYNYDSVTCGTLVLDYWFYFE